MSYPLYISRLLSICTFAVLILNTGIHAFAQSSPSDGDARIDFPYQAIVRNDDTEVLSGPAAVHYATDKISQGDVVQVYRHDPDGWCAIRPNEGSFSLIPSAAVEIVDDGVGEIKQDNTQAWVGTRLGSVEKPLWQIKLREGEEVEILGEASWPSPDGHSTIWYQIAPPAGEFRWVRYSDLQTPPTDTISIADTKPTDESPEVASSGFKYDSPSTTPAQDGNEDAAIDSNFKYVDSKPSTAKPSIRSVARSNPTQPNSQWTRLPDQEKRAAATGSPDRGPSPSPDRIAARDSRTAAQPPRDQPKRVPEEGIDFKFRPIGQTASVSGSFKSSAGEDVIRDSAVKPAAFQGPVYDSNSRSDDQARAAAGRVESYDSGWQRGREKIAQRKRQYEARYDDFNTRDRLSSRDRYDTASGFSSRDNYSGRDSFDQRDIEDSFGVRMEDLPSHPQYSRDRQYGRDGGRYETRIENAFPPADRYASLDTRIEITPHSTLSEKLTTRLAKAEEQLTNEMLKRPNEWQLADLELGVGQIYSQTSNPVERLQSQRILDKISKCKVIRNGYTKNFQATGETFGTSVRPLSDTRDVQFAIGETYSMPGDATSSLNGSLGGSQSRVVGSGVNTDFETSTRYDASGWMTELVSEDRNNRPVYVLVDDAGQITHHIAGTPGLNLHRYLKSKVGVLGRRGYNNHMKLDHITAESIDELQR